MDDGPVMYVLWHEANRQCVRLGHDCVLPVHLLLAVAAVDQQMLLRGAAFRERLAPHNQGREVLQSHHVTYWRLMSKVGVVAPADAAVSDRAPKAIRRGPPWSTDAVATIDLVQQLAQQRGHKQPGTAHLLAAIFGNATPDVLTICRRIGLEPRNIQDDAIRLLS